MKKSLLLFILILFTIGCVKEKISLESKYYNNPTFQEIEKTELINLEKNHESFLIMVYTTGCFSCMDFEEVLTEFVSANNLNIFRINITDITNTKLENKIKYTPSLVIYQKGKVYKYLDANSDKDKDYYKSIDSLKVWLSKYILLETN